MEAFVYGYKHKCLEGSLILCKFDSKFSPRVMILSVIFFSAHGIHSTRDEFSPIEQVSNPITKLFIFLW